jgi:hypothetical protein
MAKTFQDTITVTFKGKGEGLERTIKALDKATKSLIKSQAKLVTEGKRVKDVQKKLATQTTITGKKVGILTTRNKRLAQTNSVLANSFATIRSKLLLVNFALALGVRQIMKFTAESAKLNSMHRAFTSLSGSTFKASVSLTKLKEATNDTMSEFDLFQQANNAMILGVSKNSDEMAGMFDMAQRLGDALGKGTRESVESLITGIGRQSKLMLDNIGIMVQSQKAYDDYADALNITTDELSDLDRKQAFLNATMAAGVQKLKGLPPEIINAQKQFEQLSTSIENLSARIGNVLIPVLSGGTQELTKFMNSIDDKKIVMLISSLEALATSFVAIRGGIALGTIAVNALSVGVGVLGATLIATGIPALMAGLVVTLGKMYDIVNQQALAFEKLTKAIIEHRIELASLKALFEESSMTIAEWEKANADIAQKMRDETAKKIKAANIEILELAIGLVSRKRDILNKEMQEKHFLILQARAKERDLHDKSARESIEQNAKNDFDYRQSRVENQKQLHEEMLQNEFNFLVLLQALRTEDQEALKKEHERRLKGGEGELTTEQTISLAMSQAKAASGAYSSFVQGSIDADLNALRARDSFANASLEKRQTMEDAVRKKHSDALRRAAIAERAMAIASAIMNTYVAVTKAMLNPPLAALVAGLGAAQVTAIAATPLPYEQGGLVGGRRHSQGGTIIEAEQGEFIMSRSAVESIGTSALNNMNQGGGGGITLNISAPLVDETVIDTIIPAIQKAQRMNLA